MKKIFKIIKGIIKNLLPGFIINFFRYLKNLLIKIIFKRMNNYEVFKTIYQKKAWTPDKLKNKLQFYSGRGSYDEEFTKIYIEKLEKFLTTLPKKLNVLDLGCGDFAVGSKLRNFFKEYVAIDIYDELIKFNKKKYEHLDVNFMSLDITKENLPRADVCVLRQVLQHLSNDAIQNFLSLNINKFKYIILTEHLPDAKNFTPNIDMPTSSFVRVDKNSGVVLTEPPFNLKVVKIIDLCDLTSKKITNFRGRLNTKILQLF